MAVPELRTNEPTKAESERLLISDSEVITKGLRVQTRAELSWASCRGQGHIAPVMCLSSGSPAPSTPFGKSISRESAAHASTRCHSATKPFVTRHETAQRRLRALKLNRAAPVAGPPLDRGIVAQRNKRLRGRKSKSEPCNIYIYIYTSFFV